MRTINFKRKKSPLKDLFMGFAVMTACMLLTNCGGSKSAVSTSANANMPSSVYQLSDDCALLHIYRPGTMKGMAVSYDLHLEDEVVFRVKNKTKTTLRITGEGLKTLWAKTETRVELPVDVKLGHEYYIQCGLSFGALVGRPKLEIVDNKKGKDEFAKIPSN